MASPAHTVCYLPRKTRRKGFTPCLPSSLASRAAAFQHKRITVIVDPDDLSRFAGESATDSGVLLSSLDRRSLAAKALRATSAADSRIAAALAAEDLETDVGTFSGTGAKVLVIGSGGREHAIALKLIASPRVSHVYVAPGNGGTGGVGGKGTTGVSNVDDGVLSVSDHAAVVDFVKTNGVSLVAVGPEVRYWTPPDILHMLS